MEELSEVKKNPLADFAPTIEKKQILLLETGYQPANSATAKFENLCFQFDISCVMNGTYFTWTITRSYNEFSELALELNRATWYSKGLKAPLLLKARELKKLEIAEQLSQLEIYLKTLAMNRVFCISQEFLEFLEVSLLSFEGVTAKYKEGYVYKRTGGKVINETRCLQCSKHFKRFQRRWLMVRPNAIGYLTTNFTRHWHEALMFKSKFEVTGGKKDTGFVDGIGIDTLRRHFLFRTGSVASRLEWVEAINSAFQSSEWRTSLNRYESSFPIRDNCNARSFVDGEEYFAAVYKYLKSAKHHVFISDWWLSPELYLLRPAAEHRDSQLVGILTSLAERGVNIYVHVYKEVALALTMNSLHTVKTLRAAHPNIKAIRHPHRTFRGGSFLWSHHEKLIVIDYKVAFLGGLDLCFGRMDNTEHKLVDNETKPYWNGIDYSNARIADFTNVKHWERDSIDRTTQPRLPWHDIAMLVKGKAAADVAMHFIELWNHVMTDLEEGGSKTKHLLEFRTPHAVAVREVLVAVHVVNIENKEIQSVSPERTNYEPSSPEKKARPSVTFNPQIESPQSPKFEDSPFEFSEMISPERRRYAGRSRSLEPTPKHEIFRKFSVIPSKSFGFHKFNVESLKLISSKDDPSTLVPIENADTSIQRFARRADRRGSLVAVSSPGRNTSMHLTESPFPRSNWQSVDNLREEEEVKDQEAQDLKEIEEAIQHNTEDLITSQFFEPEDHNEPRGSCHCQLLRSASLWSFGLDETEHSIHTAYLYMIDQADHFIYIENQFFISSTAGEPVKNQIAKALVERIKVAAECEEEFRVIVVMPLLPAFEGHVKDPSAAVLRIQLHWEYMTICRGIDSIYSQLKQCEHISDPQRYIRFFGLRTHAMLDDVPVTEIVYVHSKLMIVDDKAVIMGSANINDRSMLGSCDSELAMLVEDTQEVDTVLAGRDFIAKKFAYDLRMRIFKEHSGCDDESLLQDPLSEGFKEVWDNIAKNNTDYYRSIFNCYPDDQFKLITDMKEMQVNRDAHEACASFIKGYLVDFPLEFLAGESLNFTIFNKEFYVPDINFI